MTDWLHRLTAVTGREARLAVWGEALRSLSPGEGAAVLDGLVHAVAARAPDALDVYLPLLDLPELTARAGPSTLADVLEAARAEDREGCLLLLEHPGRRRAADRAGPPPDPLLENWTLGHKKTAARGVRGPLLERILKDPDPRVLREVVRNPRLREHEVLEIASRRPCPEEVFRLLARAESWIARPAVRRAVAWNPYAPAQLAVAILPTLLDGDLSDFAGEASAGFLAQAAGLILGWKGADG